MAQLIECIPNVSEGRDRAKINELAQAIKNAEGVNLLNIDRNEAANRTVFTFAGEAKNVMMAAGNLIAKSCELIDMTSHHGEHPRMGAVDVCPFVPISGITMDELTKMAEQFAQKTAAQNNIAVYLYENNARQPHRTRLEQIRKGEYEGLSEKMKSTDWIPDFGPATFNPTFGAMVCGTRNFLVAYNINLNTKDVKIAKYIAGQIRQSGHTEIIDGEKRAVSGLFAHLKAIGWYISDFNCAQVSTNITNMDSAPMHEVYETVKRLAQEAGTDVNGSELIGLVPYRAIQVAGKHYAPERNLTEQIFAAIDAMGLGSVKPFNVNERILEIKAGWIPEL